MLKQLLSFARWGRPRFLESAPVMDACVVEEVRQAMRERVQEVPGAATARLMGAIERAPDLQALWFLRSPLMQALAKVRGELGARVALAELDLLFRQGWPDAPLSRFAALG
ncbi:hypothetical protein H8N03_11165 [Ramlibacter sp. USB13]|uniref:Uncharacterized protein n=1 Tax=Ramlibacter cellulosilyticus TaxID=2764187 RepID=A0A923SB55_9BURK|nr:hypothetical protein [Ramlibacter cellulosilyticus]MBC5783505.1 hypothetical protein [Ramlibacter cellulosilyticus]